jgi:hypothetical protein
MPPLNIFGPEAIPQLDEAITALETDEHESAKFPAGPTGLQALPDMLARLSRAPVVSIASIRGGATGAGRRQSCRSGRSVPAWCQVVDRWHGCRG